jgi:hypothetical protein
MLAGCERDPRADAPIVALVRASGALPAPAQGVDLYIAPDAITVSDAHLRHDLNDLARDPEPALTTRATPLQAGALPDTSLLIPTLSAALTQHRDRTRRLAAQLIDEEASAQRLDSARLYIHPDTPHQTILSALYTAGQAELTDPQLIVATDRGPRAIRLDTPRIGAPSTPARPDPLAALRPDDTPCQAITLYLDAAGLTMAARPSRAGHALIADAASAPPAQPADLTKLPADRCPDLMFAAAPTLRWRDIAPTLAAARLLTPDGSLYLGVATPR